MLFMKFSSLLCKTSFHSLLNFEVLLRELFISETIEDVQTKYTFALDIRHHLLSALDI